MADFSPIGLLSSDTPLEKINAINLSVVLLDYQETQLFELNSGELSLLTPEDTKGHLAFTSTLNGIRFNCSADIYHLNEFIPMVKGLIGPPQKTRIGRNTILCNVLESISNSMKQMDFIREDTSITLEATLDCNDSSSAFLEGSFSLSDAIFHDVVISRLRGKLSYRDGTASLEDLMLLLSTGDILRANANYNTLKRLVNCELDGTITPTTIVKLLGQELDTNGQFKSLDKPCHWHGKLTDYSLNAPSDNANKMFWEISEIELGSLSIDSFKFEVSLNEETIGLHDIVISSENAFSLKGHVEYFLKDASLSLILDGNIHLAGLLRAAQIEVPPLFRPGRFSILTFKVAMPKSPIRPEQWMMNTSFSLQQLRLAYWEMHDLHGVLDLDKGYLRLHDVDCKLGYYTAPSRIPLASGSKIPLPMPTELVGFDANDNLNTNVQSPKPQELHAASFSIELDLNNLMKSNENKQSTNQLLLKNTLKLRSIGDNTHSEILFWEGELSYDTRRNTMEMNGKANAFSDLFYSAFLEKSTIPDIEYFAPFFSHDIPQEFTIKIPKFRLHSPQDWRMEIDIAGQDCGFGSFKVHKATAHMKLDSQRLLFTEIKGITREGYDASLKIEVQFDPFFLKITDLSLTGDPMVCESYVMSSEANEIYKEIWRDIVWSHNDLPTINIPLIYYTSDALGSHWEFKLDGDVKAKRMLYRGQEFSNVEYALALSLPGDLVMKPIKVKVGDAELEGECDFHFFGSIPCNFKVTGKKGVIKPAQFLALLNPDLKESLETLSFQDGTTFDCQGTFFLNGADSLEITGNVNSPKCSFRDWTFYDTKATWIYENNQAFWNTEKATFMGGEFRTTGVHNIITRTTDLVCVGKEMSWEEFMKRVFKDKKKEYDNVPGRFNLTCNLQVKQDWAGHPYQLGGDGHFSLRNADLWQMPLMKQLSHLVEVTTFKLFSSNKNSKNSNTFGSISALKANVEFHGPRIVVTDFNTNGTIIALSGAGEYNTFNDNVHFEVNGSPLKEVTILSTLLKPLSWCFNAELQGKRSEAKWKMKTALSKIFSTED